MYVYPKPGFKVFDPHLKDYLPAEGRTVPDIAFWHRRVQDGDVTLEPPAAVPVAAADAQAHQTIHVAAGDTVVVDRE